MRSSSAPAPLSGPGLTGYVSRALGLHPDAYLQDLAGLGCGAAIPTCARRAIFWRRADRHGLASSRWEICSPPSTLTTIRRARKRLPLRRRRRGHELARTARPGALHCFDFETWHVRPTAICLRFEIGAASAQSAAPKRAAARAAGVAGSTPRSPRAVHGVAPRPGGARRDRPRWRAALPDHPSKQRSRAPRQPQHEQPVPCFFALEEQCGPAAARGRDLWLVSFGAGSAR